jgi:glycosyltransferase involved in cell wall biosynthesis
MSSPTAPLELAVVLPTYNERDNVAPLIARLEAALAGIGWEAIFVDDDSTDGTADALRALAGADRRIRVIQRIGRRGLASAAIEGMCATAAPVVAVMDADQQHDPALLPAMLAAIRGGECDVAVASRFAPGASTAEWNRPDREKASALANALARKVTGVELSDPMSGFFMLRAETLRRDAHRLSGIGFKILLDILATVDAPLGSRSSRSLRRARRGREQARPHGGVRVPRRALRQVARADHPDPLRAVRHDRRGGRGRAHGGAERVPRVFGGSFKDHLSRPSRSARRSPRWSR